MKKTKAPTFRVGTVVRLRRKVQRTGKRQTTHIRSFLEGIPGGVWLEEALERSRGWNVADLEIVSHGGR